MLTSSSAPAQLSKMDPTKSIPASVIQRPTTPQQQQQPQAHQHQQNLLEDAELALEKLAHQESRLVVEAEQLFKRQVDYIKLIDELKHYVPNMETIDANTKKLATLVESSSSLVEDVCSKVKRIDLAKTRLEDCLSRVVDILDLKTCRKGFLDVMKVNNYEEAAMHIKRYLSIDQTQLRKTIDMICGQHGFDQQPRFSHLLANLGHELESTGDKTLANDEFDAINPRSINLALEELDAGRINLLKLCQDNLNRAIANNDTRDIDRFFKLFPMLNEHHFGLKRYAEFLQNKIVSVKLDEVFKSKQVNQADKLAALYENLAKLVDSHQPLVETYYGPGHLIEIVRVLQKECDRLSRKILEEFRNETKLQYVAKVVRAASIQTPISTPSNYQANTPNTSSRLDPRDVDNILNEISVIISRSEVYLNFIVERLKDDMNSKSGDENQRKDSSLELYNLVCVECELNHLIQEVGGIYVMLEQYYLNESSKRAILMDKIDTEATECFVSSMLDDIFFIIKKCTQRAVSTKSIEVFCAVINHCVTLLESTFCQALEERLKNQQYYTGTLTSKNLDLTQAYSAIQSGRYLQSAGEIEIARAQYFAALNNLNKACDYIRSLKSILDVDTKKLRPSPLVIEQQLHNQIEKSKTCLHELTQLVNRFSSIANSSLYQLFNTSLRSRLRTELKNVMDENPDLISILSQNSDEIISLAKNLLITVDRTLQGSLTPENYNKLVSITKDYLSSTMNTSNI